MGTTSSTPVAGDYSSNDYELVIKASKALEAQLEHEFQSQGKGLHEHINSAQRGLHEPLVKKLRYIATIRNKLIHEPDFHRVPDRTVFINLFEESTEGLTTIAHQRRAAARGGNAATGETSSCSIM